MDLATRRVDLESQTSDRTSERKVSQEYFLPISVEQKKDALQGILRRRIDRLQQHGFEIRQIKIEHGVKQLLLALEEKIKTAAIRASFLKNLSHACGFEALGIKKLHSGKNDPITG